MRYNSLMLTQINFAPGDTVRVHQLIREIEKGEEKSRTQIFEGVVLAIKGRQENKSFTVRKLVGDIAVERIYPVFSPNIEKVDVVAHPKHRVRRSKLYNLRKRA